MDRVPAAARIGHMCLPSLAQMGACLPTCRVEVKPALPRSPWGHPDSRDARAKSLDLTAVNLEREILSSR